MVVFVDADVVNVCV